MVKKKNKLDFYHVIVAAETEKRMDLQKDGGGSLTPSNNKQLLSLFTKHLFMFKMGEGVLPPVTINNFRVGSQSTCSCSRWCLLLSNKPS